MPQEDDQVDRNRMLTEGGPGARPMRGDIRMATQALTKGWHIPDQVREMVIRKAATIVASSTNQREVVAAMRLLVAADMVNARREENAIQERAADLAVGTAAMRELLKGSAARKALVDLSEEMCEPGVVQGGNRGVTKDLPTPGESGGAGVPGHGGEVPPAEAPGGPEPGIDPDPF